MPQTYKKAFALNDNPFSPKQLFPGVRSQVMTKSIYVGPLRLDEDYGLRPLFVGDAGPFDEHYREYKDKLAGENYLEDAGDGATSVGNNTFIFIIHGSIGTGKTTLMNLMLHHLKQCKPPGAAWSPFKAQYGTSLSEADQNKALDDVKKLIEGKSPDYCYLVLDNLVWGADQKAFDLYQEFEFKRQLLMFVTTHDDNLRKSNWDHWGLPIISYKMAELSPDDAVAFVRHRVKLFRDPAMAHLFQNEYELFPFREKNIRESVQPRGLGDAAGDIVNLRQLSKVCTGTLEKLLPGRPDLFGGDGPPAAPAAVSKRLSECALDLIESNREIIEKVAA